MPSDTTTTTITPEEAARKLLSALPAALHLETPIPTHLSAVEIAAACGAVQTDHWGRVLQYAWTYRRA